MFFIAKAIQEDPDQLLEIVKEIAEVKVSAKKKESVMDGTPGETELDLMQAKELPNFGGVADVVEHAKRQPSFKTAGEGNSGYYVRGGGLDQNLVMLDETVLYNPSHLLGFFSVFNADAVKNIELIKGGMPANYGGRLASVLDISMTDAVISSRGWVVSNYVVGGQEPMPRGNENCTSAPSGTFRTADAPINIAANRDEQWESLAHHLGRPDLLDHPDYATREDRTRNRDSLREELEATLVRRSSNDWVQELSALGIPTGPVLTVPQVLAEPQVRGRNLMADFQGEGGIRVLASPVVADGERPTPQSNPPELGQHNSAIFQELGLDSEVLRLLAIDGVI